MPDHILDGKKRILVVDDEPIIADTVVQIFSMHGHSSRAAYSAEQALDLLSEWEPYLAIIDIKLPGMSGVDLAIRMKAEHPHCKLSLISGFIDPSQLLKSATEAGHTFDFHTKPVLPATLLQLAADLPQTFGDN